jgi:hypothetical protein
MQARKSVALNFTHTFVWVGNFLFFPLREEQIHNFLELRTDEII